MRKNKYKFAYTFMIEVETPLSWEQAIMQLKTNISQDVEKNYIIRSCREVEVVKTEEIDKHRTF